MSRCSSLPECLAQSEPGAEPGAGQVFSLWDGDVGVQMSQFLSSLLNELEAVKNHPRPGGRRLSSPRRGLSGFSSFSLTTGPLLPPTRDLGAHPDSGAARGRVSFGSTARLSAASMMALRAFFRRRQAADRLLSGSIRQAAGLNFPERKMGLVALDFIQNRLQSRIIFDPRAARARGNHAAGTLLASAWSSWLKRRGKIFRTQNEAAGAKN